MSRERKRWKRLVVCPWPRKEPTATSGPFADLVTHLACARAAEPPTSDERPDSVRVDLEARPVVCRVAREVDGAPGQLYNTVYMSVVEHVKKDTNLLV